MRFEGELQGGYGQMSCVKNAQTLTEACWSRKISLGPGKPWTCMDRSYMMYHAKIRPAELIDGVLESGKL